ncbi:MAG: YgiQ family radical SAM protein [Deltaproteobacteria bacterium]|nr:YgiQ family radical SAM protein [Deltaproteobacteria bacterium]
MKTNPNFLPITATEMKSRGWEELDILFISGDAYVDHPAFGIPLLARMLEQEGFRVGIIPQPDWKDPDAFKVMGRPRLFAAVSTGAMDSMVNHYTAAKKVRNNDAYTPGGRAGARPNRGLIAYTAALKNAFPGIFVVIGGIEASLRSLAHYDYWDKRVRRSILVDSKADLLVYGMGEHPLLEFAGRARSGEPLPAINDIRGTAIITKKPPKESVLLPSFEEVENDKDAYNRAFRLTVEGTARGLSLVQEHGSRRVMVNPQATPLSEKEMDALYDLPFQKLPHPSYKEPIPAYEQIRFSITSHRGCFGGCAFCAIASHQGKTIQSRSEGSIVREIAKLTRHPEFRGTVTDVGGPTANMYGLSCTGNKFSKGCDKSSCLFPTPCSNLKASGGKGAALLKKIRRIAGVKHVFVASGVRYDLLEKQPEYLNELLSHHVGGLLKVAPETLSAEVARVMRKPGPDCFDRFLKLFREKSRKLNLRQAVVPYLISGHPGCTLSHMVDTAIFLKRNNLRVEQVQEFTPTPGTLATCIYYTGKDPFSGEKVHVPTSDLEKRLQKSLLLWHVPENRADIRKALKLCGRESDTEVVLGKDPKGRKGIKRKS